MDLSNEVCVKIKSAIKARLKELGIIWDHELPDYVMVLIKNKKSKEQMENDLNIFLGSHTVDFTNWLYDVWKKLEACTVTSKASKNRESEEEKLKLEQNTSEDDRLEQKKSQANETNFMFKYLSDADISSVYTHPFHGASPLHRYDKDSRTLSSNVSSSFSNNLETDKQRRPRERIEINWQEDKSSGRENEYPNRSQSSRSRSRSSRSRGRSRSSSRAKEEKGGYGGRRNSKERKYKERSKSREKKGVRDAREYIRKRMEGTNGRKNWKDEKSSKNKEKKSRKQTDYVEDKLPSLVKVTPRPVRPLSIQPSSNLILKAVAEAQKSIAVTSLPQPEDKLGHDDDNKKTARKKPFFKKKLGAGFEPNISVTLLNDRISSSTISTPQTPEVIENVEENKFISQDGHEIQRFTISLQSDDDSLAGSDHEENDPTLFEPNFAKEVQTEPVQTPLAEAEPMDISVEGPMEEIEVSDYPVYRFDRSRLGPRVVPVVPDTDTVLSCLAPSSHITKTIVNDSAFSECSDDNDKLIKCKFWPSCEAGDTCRFYHPKTYCRTLPNCKYGQKCLFIHPPCKFADKCLNVTCPYTHDSTASTVTGKVWAKVPLAPSNGQICMFFPNCTKPFCPYQHYAASGSGISCKYGASCSKVSCEFDHPQSSKNPYKWVAANPE